MRLQSEEQEASEKGGGAMRAPCRSDGPDLYTVRATESCSHL